MTDVSGKTIEMNASSSTTPSIAEGGIGSSRHPKTMPMADATAKLYILDDLSKSMHTTNRESFYPIKSPLEEQTSWIVDETRRTVDSLQRGSQFFDQNPPKLVPIFDESELMLGQSIGNGQFGMVFEVTGFRLRRGKNHPPNKQNSHVVSYAEESGEIDDFPMSLDTDGTKTYMTDNLLRDGSPRFAVKRVRLDLVDERKGSSSIDLAVEAKFLASIDHSNIIKLRGTVSTPGYDSFMIILDRLYSILNKTIEQWREEVRATRGIFGWKVIRKVDHYKAKTERLVCLYDIARALKHLHSLKILFRDVKPENIGRDIRGNYKIFDLGLSKELRQGKPIALVVVDFLDDYLDGRFLNKFLP